MNGSRVYQYITVLVYYSELLVSGLACWHDLKQLGRPWIRSYNPEAAIASLMPCSLTAPVPSYGRLLVNIIYVYIYIYSVYAHKCTCTCTRTRTCTCMRARYSVCREQAPDQNHGLGMAMSSCGPPGVRGALKPPRLVLCSVTFDRQRRPQTCFNKPYAHL